MLLPLISIVLCVKFSAGLYDDVDVDVETLQKLDNYIKPLEDWQKKIFENWRPEYGKKAWIYSNQKEGDIIVKPSPFGRYGRTDEYYRWPDKTVVINYNIALTYEERHIIKGALQEISENSCIKFKQRINEDDYVTISVMFNLVRSDTTNYPYMFQNGPGGCFSAVGRQGGEQEMNLQSNSKKTGFGCMFHEIVLHEMFHTLGFAHDHSAPDADKYITIHLENVRPGLEDQFEPRTDDEVTNFGVEYHHDSIMHYTATEMSKNGEMTMVPKDPNVNVQSMGTAQHLSKGDITRLNRMYHCK